VIHLIKYHLVKKSVDILTSHLKQKLISQFT